MADEKDYFEEQPEDEGTAETGDAGSSDISAAQNEVGEAAEAAAEPAEAASPKNWYIIHTYSGFENKVQESLRTRAEAFGFADKIGQILIPTEEVVELRNGKKVTSKRLVYPGYVLVEMEMNDALWHEVKNTPRVTGFVGGGNAPVPLSPEEVNSILNRQASSAERPRPKMTFEKERSGADCGRAVREFFRKGGRSQSGARHIARDGDDFRTRDAGGTGILAGGKRLTYGEEDYSAGQAADSGG